MLTASTGVCFHPPGSSGQGVEIIEFFCAMHLGVNLRKAFLTGLNIETSVNHPVDAFVYEFTLAPPLVRRRSYSPGRPEAL